ncbi:MAG: hypothetical protein M1830_007174 [Pleopsidium flavum]|nr:MAG: hypothetical protein M1830_007174 [Pleopsidium flavum]
MATTLSPGDPSIHGVWTGFGSERRRWTVTELAILREECCKPPHNVGRRHQQRREDGLMPLTGSEDIPIIPPDELIEMIRPLRSSSLFDQLATPILDLALQDKDMHDEDSAGALGFTEQTSIGKQFDIRVWEVIQKELMDWYQPNQLNHRRGYSTHLLPAEGCGQLASVTALDDPDRIQVLITMVAVQLLATCFTLPPEPERCSLPSAFHYNRAYKKVESSDPRLISSLKLHTQHRDAPAFGHNARNPSFALVWPDLCSEPSREERLAEEISKRRRLRQTQIEGHNQEASRNSRRSRSERLSAEMEDYTFAPRARWRRYRSSTEVTSIRKAPFQRPKIDRIFGHPTRFGGESTLPLQSPSRTTRPRPSWSSSMVSIAGIRNRYHNSAEYTHRWSLQPILRFEAHPIFIQPVKDHVVRRWRAFKSRSTSRSSTSTSDDSFSRRNRRWTRAPEITSVESPLARSRQPTETLTSRQEASRLSVPTPDATPLSLITFPESDESSSSFLTLPEPSTTHPTGPMTSPHPLSPLVTVPEAYRREENPTFANHEPSSYFPPVATTSHASVTIERSFKRRLERSSTVGTTLFSPPIIAQASPNSEKVASEGAGSSGSSSTGLGIGQLHFL